MKAATISGGQRRISGGISIHAAREGGDEDVFFSRVILSVFQSTPPVKAATTDSPDKAQYRKISIHAAREGGDQVRRTHKNAEGISIHAAREGGDPP
mgnify:CR=1 FL=1